MDLAEVYETHVSKIYNYIFFRVMHQQIAEDLVSTVFLKVTENFASFKPDRGSVATWIQKIAENTLIDYFRHPRAVHLNFDDLSEDARLSVDFDEQSTLIKDETRRELYAALSTLDNRTREIISEKYFFDKTIRQIAEEKDMNEKTVSTIHNRGLAALRKTLEAFGR
ncbi:MAG: sigma-70 family RNA polymerase sigma factor [Oscillospiraceae bacterium]|nr:sigma-70 family RNA polymerase sigma factor [Oscillospiraceae bacterium]